MIRQAPLDKLFETQTRYGHALAEAEERRAERDTALLAVTDIEGMTVRKLAELLGLSPGRIQQLIQRAKKDARASATAAQKS